jgi:hypothetical protein
VTLAGFTGILAAMRYSADDGPLAGQSSRIGSVLIIPAIVLSCALLPFALSDFTSSPAVIWGVPLCMYGVLSGTLLVLTVSQVLRGSLPLITPGLGYAVMAASAALQLLALLSGLGLVLPFSPGMLVLGLTWSLLGAAFALVAAVAVAVRPPT